MPASRALVLGLYFGALLAPAPAVAWRQWVDDPPSYDYGVARAVALDAAGDVVVAGYLQPGTGSQFSAVKFDGASGVQLWRRDIAGSSVSSSASNVAWAVAVDVADNVVVAGRLTNTGTGTEFTVVKLSGANGTELWRREIDGPASAADWASAAVVDAAGDVIAAGYLDTGAGNVFLVVKLAGTTGAELWRQELPGTDPSASEFSPVPLAVDGANDVIAGGQFGDGPSVEFVVVKLAGSDGAEQWRAIDATGVTQFIALTAGGDAVAAGELFNPSVYGSRNCLVTRLDGSTGAQEWRREISGPGSFEDYGGPLVVDAGGDIIATCFVSGGDGIGGVKKLAGGTGADIWTQSLRDTKASLSPRALAVTGAGDVVVAGQAAKPNALTYSRDFGAAKLDGATGAVLWRQALDGEDASNLDSDTATAVAVDAAGDVVAAGFLYNSTSGASTDLAVMKLSGLDGAAGPVPGRRLVVSDAAGNPDARRILAVVSHREWKTPPGGSVGDPTLNGGSVTLVNPTTLESATFTLPAASWQALGEPPGSLGYKYLDSAGSNGPCKLVLVKPGYLRAACSGQIGSIPFTLDEPTQGTLVLSAQLGSADAQCLRFGGDVRRDTGTANPGPRGLFVATNAPAFVGGCP